MAAEPREVGFLPLAGLTAGEAQPWIEQVSGHLAVPCRLLGAPAVELVKVPGRDQLDADRLLYQIEALAEDGEMAGRLLVGLTARDVATPLFTFVFGRARVAGSAAVVSTARLDPRFYGLPADPVLTARRATAEILHELGHVAGLGHCRDAACLMHFSGTVEAVDLRGLAFCAACAAALPAATSAPVLSRWPRRVG